MIPREKHYQKVRTQKRERLLAIAQYLRETKDKDPPLSLIDIVNWAIETLGIGESTAYMYIREAVELAPSEPESENPIEPQQEIPHV